MVIQNSFQPGDFFNRVSMVERFFFSERQMFFQDGQEENQSESQTKLIMLLSGPPSCGKTSLAFQFAYNTAMQETQFNSGNGKVVFLCNRRRLESKPPFLSQEISSSSDIFQRIQMKYVDDDEDIKKYFAAFHLHDSFPAAVVVDDFGDFFHERSCQERYNNPRGRDLAMVRTLALCQNAIVHANETRPCKLLLSDTHHGDSPRLLFIYKRWVPTIFTIQGDGSGSGSFLLKCNSNLGSDCSLSKRTARGATIATKLRTEKGDDYQ